MGAPLDSQCKSPFHREAPLCTYVSASLRASRQRIRIGDRARVFHGRCLGTRICRHGSQDHKGKMMTRKQFILVAPFAATVMRGAVDSREAPELFLTDTSGKQVRLSLLRGKVVVLEFMLTTCPHCQNTARLLSRLQREYGPKGRRKNNFTDWAGWCNSNEAGSGAGEGEDAVVAQGWARCRWDSGGGRDKPTRPSRFEWTCGE